MPAMQITRFSALMLSAFIITIPVAQAGFEFTPSKAAPAPIQQTVSAPPALEPLALIPTPVAPVAPPMNIPASAPMKPKGLYIDPYPLRNQGNTAMMPSDNSVSLAMSEQGGALTPVQLGNGMTTGVKPVKQRAAPTSSQNSNDMMNNAAPVSYVASENLTPIPGGEPAPLPGIMDAYQNSSIQSSDMPKIYANAVGFGRDLPLELAISQIIPADFSHRIMGQLDENATTSWEGGEPWNIVLNNMLRTQNMTAIVQGNEVIIQPMARL